MINVNMTDKAGVTLATAGKYCADNVKVTPSADILRKDEQAKTATPTTSAQDITPDAGKALSKVTVNPITAAIVGNLDASSFAASIVAAIEGKGVTVPEGTLLDGMAALIESIEAGGVGGTDEYVIESGTFTPAEAITDSYVIETHFGPPYSSRFFVCYRDPYFIASSLSLKRGISVIGYVPLYKDTMTNAKFGGYVGGANTNNNNLENHNISYSNETYTITCSSTAPLSANRYHWIAVAVSEGI